MEDLELSDGTLRQRRNLLLVSTLLILMHHAEITLGNSISFQGLTLDIGNPSAISEFIYMALAYFLWRFYQYFHIDKADTHLRQQFRASRERLLNRALGSSVSKRVNFSSFQGSFDYANLKSISPLKYKYKAIPLNDFVDDTGELEVIIPKYEIEVMRIKNIFLFAFRGKILTDFFLPYLMAIYAAYTTYI